MKKILSFFLFLFLIPAVHSQSSETGAMLGLNNAFTANDSFSKGIYTGSETFANLASLVGTTNVVYLTDGTSGSNPCTGSGTGAFAFYVNGSWNCNLGSSGSGLP